MQKAAGILPFFDDGKLVLLGQEFRKRNNSYYWMEFGGKLEPNETLAQTAHREFNEETAQSFHITLEQVELADQKGYFVDHFNEKTGVYYRMYCLNINGDKPSIDTIYRNSKGKSDVGKIAWQYFETSKVLKNQNGIFSESDVPL